MWGGGFFGRFITLSFMEFKRKVIGEMCNKHYKLVVTLSILCYNGVFRTSFTSHCKCTKKKASSVKWEGYFKLRGCFEMFLIYKKCKYIVKQNNCKL